MSLSAVDVILKKKLSLHKSGEQPMDLSVSQRLVHPGPDSAMLTPHPAFFLGHLSSQHCSQFSQQHVEVSAKADMELLLSSARAA